MEEIFVYINSNVTYAPYLIFGLLILAGFNIPISEDLMLFTAAILAAENPEQRVALFLGVYLGAYLSDLICYWTGRMIGPHIFKLGIIGRFINQKKVDRVSAFYERYGIMTLLFGRFIPFGVRNALFLSAGLCKMNFIKFALTDFLAVTISSFFFFYVYYQYGGAVIQYVKKGNIALLGVAIFIALLFYLKKRMTSKKPNKNI